VSEPGDTVEILDLDRQPLRRFIRDLCPASGRGGAYRFASGPAAARASPP
jgi:hypothetical protein